MMDKVDKKLELMEMDKVNIIVLLIGIVFTVISIGVSGNNVRTILVSIGCSLIASAIVSYLSARYLVRRNKIKDIINNWKIEGIYETRQQANIPCDEHMKDLKDELDIIAFGLRSFRDSKNDLIKDKVKRGLKIRILTIHPESVYLKQREIDEQEVEGQIKNTILELKKWIDELKEIAPKSEDIQIKFYKCLPLDFYFREDDYIYVGPYLYGKTSQQTITYEYIKDGQGYEYYKKYFDELWKVSKC